jgi:hypothetical protein
MSPKLDHHHRKTANKIFAHPMSHNIQWHDVETLLERIGVVGQSHSGNVTVTVGEVVYSLGKAHGHDLNDDQVVKVRHVLRDAGVNVA